MPPISVFRRGLTGKSRCSAWVLQRVGSVLSHTHIELTRVTDPIPEPALVLSLYALWASRVIAVKPGVCLIWLIDAFMFHRFIGKTIFLIPNIRWFRLKLLLFYFSSSHWIWLDFPRNILQQPYFTNFCGFSAEKDFPRKTRLRQFPLLILWPSWVSHFWKIGLNLIVRLILKEPLWKWNTIIFMKSFFEIWCIVSLACPLIVWPEQNWPGLDDNVNYSL